MGAKTFINQTGHPLSVNLTVRAGDEPPGNESGYQTFPLAVSQSLYFVYSDSANPYLDSIFVKATDGSGLMPGEVTVYTKQDPADNELNTNNTVTFSVQNQAIIISCTNVG